MQQNRSTLYCKLYHNSCSSPGQEQKYQLVEFCVVVECSIWKIKERPEMQMRFLNSYQQPTTDIVLGPFGIKQ